ncbi:MAG: archaeal proteasome endopeptidase complex subunit beta [Candidatus Nanohaloarchaea archaeon]
MQNEQVNKNDEKMEEFKTGTTTLSLVTDEGVIMAADTRASLGTMTSAKNVQKIHKLDDSIGITIAGGVGDAQKIIRLMRSQLKLHKLETKELTVKGAGTLLANILHGNKMMPFMNQFLLGGTDDDGGVIFTLGPTGSLVRHDNFATTGSGSPMVYGVLEDDYEEGMGHEDGKELAVRAVEAAMERDTGSGNGIMVVEITDEGYEVMEEKEVESRLE